MPKNHADAAAAVPGIIEGGANDGKMGWVAIQFIWVTF